LLETSLLKANQNFKSKCSSHLPCFLTVTLLSSFSVLKNTSHTWICALSRSFSFPIPNQ
jgi:hypothetical protein